MRHTIGRDVFEVGPIPALRSFTLQARIAPALAEVAAAIQKVGASGTLEEANVEELAPAVGRFFSKLPEAELEHVVRALLANTKMNGLPLFSGAGDPIDTLMAGRTLDVWRLLWFALQECYPDFFVHLGALRGAKAAGSPSEG